MHASRLTLILVTALACAGLGAWLGSAIADDAGSIVVVALACGVLGSFAPVTAHWLAGAIRGRGGAVR